MRNIDGWYLQHNKLCPGSSLDRSNIIVFFEYAWNDRIYTAILSQSSKYPVYLVLFVNCTVSCWRIKIYILNIIRYDAVKLRSTALAKSSTRPVRAHMTSSSSRQPTTGACAVDAASRWITDILAAWKTWRHSSTRSVPGYARVPIRLSVCWRWRSRVTRISWCSSTSATRAFQVNKGYKMEGLFNWRPF